MRLVIQSGTQAGSALEVTKATIAIGRGTNNDVVLSDLAASRNHCQIRREANGLMIQDMGSVNGTSVNGEKIGAPRLLRIGDAITIGQTTLRLEESQPATVPASPLPVAAQVPVSPVAPAGGSNVALWALVAGGLIGLVVIGSMFAMIMLNQPTPTLLPVVQATSAASAIPIALTPTPAPTSTLAPTSEVTITPANRNPEATFTPLPTLTPTATPTKFYLEPRVLLPAPRTKFTQNEQVAFSWTPIGTLRTLDYYRVQIARDSDFHIIACEIRSKDTLVSLQPGSCNDAWQFNNRYFWRVQVIALDGAGNAIVLSPEPAQIYDMSWAP